MPDATGNGSGVGVAILVTTIGGVMVYSALKGISITDAVAGKSGDTLNAHGAANLTQLPALTPTPQPGTLGVTTPGSGWTAPPGGADHFSGPHAGQLNKLAGVAQNVYHLHITATTNGTHVGDSYHYRDEAFDAAGNPADMEAFAKYVYDNVPQVSELIHNGATHGYAIKDGVKVNGSSVFAAVWPGHRNHVHVAWG